MALKPSTKNVNGVIVPSFLPTEVALQVMNMSPKPGDIIICTYPKCGTNWVSQIVSLLLRNGVPPSNKDEFLKTCPFVTFVGVDYLNTLPEPRCYKTHFDYSIIPKSEDAKYICVIRNPKDCLVSLYHFLQSDYFGFKGGDFNVLFDLFMKGEVMYNDYFDHLMSLYDHKNDPNVLFLYYEKMHDDLGKVVKEIAKFMEGDYVKLIEDPKILANIIKYSSFNYMRDTTNSIMKSVFEDEACEIDAVVMSQILANSKEAMKRSDRDAMKFVRKGIVGDWRNLFSVEQNRIMDEKIEKRLNRTEMLEYWKSIGCI